MYILQVVGVDSKLLAIFTDRMRLGFCVDV